jgi:hypothetical protein
VDHQHNHRGQCWWEIRKESDMTAPSAPGELAGSNDVRLKPEWNVPAKPMDTYQRANDPQDKKSAG